MTPLIPIIIIVIIIIIGIIFFYYKNNQIKSEVPVNSLTDIPTDIQYTQPPEVPTDVQYMQPPEVPTDVQYTQPEEQIIQLLEKPTSDITNPTPDFNPDPCSLYKDDDKNISLACINKLWETSGCPTKILKVSAENIKDIKNDTKQQIIYGISNIAKTYSPESKELCYSDMTQDEYDAKFNINPCDRFKDTDIVNNDACIRKIWRDAGCTQLPSTSNLYSDYAKQSGTKAWMINDSKSWATLDGDKYRQGCYGLTQQEYNDRKTM